jgi:maltose O-acetyltransferase
MKKGIVFAMRGDDKMDSDFNRAIDLLRHLNNAPGASEEHKTSILHQLLGSAGEGLSIQQNFHCDLGYNIHVGKNFRAGRNCTILDMAEVGIGDNCKIGPNVGIYTAGHTLNPVDRNKTCIAYPVAIGNNVQIGGNAMILAGITIGDNSIVEPGSIVTKDVPANVVVTGNPAKMVRDVEG